MKTKLILIFCLINLFLNNQSFSLENKIMYKINNEIITSYDIIKERKYLILLNPNLKNLEKRKLNILAKDSIIKEKIKKIEVENYFEIQKSLSDEYLLNIIERLYKNLDINNEKEFEKYLKNQNLKLEFVKNKLAVEMLWNNLIFSKFNKMVSINENLIKDKIEKELLKKDKLKNYNLSEIFIKNNKELNIQKIYKEILDSINKVGFDNTANIYSKSESAKFGGKIGWISETSLSNSIKKNLENLGKNEISKPIKISQNYVIIKINEIRDIKKKIDKNKIFKERIEFERNQQLERYSLAYLNKIKKNTKINEL